LFGWLVAGTTLQIKSFMIGWYQEFVHKRGLFLPMYIFYVFYPKLIIYALAEILTSSLSQCGNRKLSIKWCWKWSLVQTKNILNILKLNQQRNPIVQF